MFTSLVQTQPGNEFFVIVMHIHQEIGVHVQGYPENREPLQVVVHVKCPD